MMNGRKIYILNYPKRIAALFILAVMAAGLLSGCKEKAGDTDTDTKGRYVEEDIELPVQGECEILNMIKSKEGNPVIFICESGTKLIRLEYKDGKWEQVPLEWVNELYGEQTLYFQEVQETSDGVQIVRGISEDALTHIARSSDGKTGAELNIPYLKQKGEYGYPAVTSLEIDGNGNYWMNDFYDSRILVISAETLEVIEEMNSAQVFSGEQRVLYAAADGGIAVNTEDGVFTLYNTNLHEQETIKTKKNILAWMCSDGDIWYQISEKGIERIVPGNEVTEVIMDGSMGMMGQTSNVVKGMTAGASKDFYVLYGQEKASTAKLVHYVYNEKLSSVPKDTLRVFGLVENKTVQEAVVGFQKAHPDVRIEFQTAGNEDISVSEMSMGTAGKIFQQGMFSNQGSPAILNHLEGAATDRIDSVSNMMIPYEIMRRLELSPDTLKDFYVPKGIAAINQNTKQKELAEEFVKYLFSGEVQSAQVDDGLPVLNSALEGLADETDSKYAEDFCVTSSWEIEGEGVLEIEAGYPLREEVEALITMCKALKNPAGQNLVIWNIYQTEADQCLEGSIDAGTAAKNIAQKVDTYLAE